MNRKTTWIAGIVAIFAISMGAVSGSFAEGPEKTEVKPTVPRY